MTPFTLCDQIPDASAAAKSLLKNGISSCQLTTNGAALSITSTVGETTALRFFNSGNSGNGGRYVSLEAVNAGVTGTLPFTISGLEYIVNDDASTDYCVLMGHGFNSNATLMAGAQWGASGIKFEQHWNPSAGNNQSETYFIHVSRSGQEYRGFALIHQNHDRIDGTDTLYGGISVDQLQIQDGHFVNRGVWDSLGLSMSLGQRLYIANSVVRINGTTGNLTTDAINNTFAGQLTTDDNDCVTFQPTFNMTVNGKTCFATYVNPVYTAVATNSTIYGHRATMTRNKGTGFYDGFTDCRVGVTGAGVTGSRIFGHRVQLEVSTSASINFGYGFWAQTPISTGTYNAIAAFKADDHTGHYVFQGGTGKYAFGDASANTLVGFHAATPIAQQTVAAAATDPATTQTLANSLRTILLNLGLCK